LTRYPDQERITDVKSARPSALVVGTVIVGTVAFVAPLWLLDTDWSYWLFVFGPLLLGALVALVARGRARLLGIAAATFMALGIIGLIALEWGRSEGGLFAVLVFFAEIVALYATAGVWWIVSRLGTNAERFDAAGGKRIEASPRKGH
jgi:uncharacterized membrane protein